MPSNSRNIPELYQFNPKRLVIFILSALILVGSWRLCGSQCCTFKRDHSLRISIWNRIDLVAFRFFNRWLLSHDKTTLIAKLFVAINSAGIGEIISNLTFILITSWIFSSKFIFPNQTRLLKISVLLAMIIYGMIGQMILSKLSRDYLCPNRPSPAVVFRFSTIHLEEKATSSANSFTIDRLFEEAKNRDLVKEIAYDSWPGEHTAVNLIWSLFMSTIISRSSNSLSTLKRFLMYMIVWFFAILFSIARLVSGAHWLSDCLAGGLSEALIVVAIGIYTPVFRMTTKLIHWLINRSKIDDKKLP
jgi:membrane-associated phospholipid phosphatase